MRQLQDRTPDQIFARYRDAQPRVYEADGVQSDRIQRSRLTVLAALKGLDPVPETHKRFRIIELGCGLAEISGHYSKGHNVNGYDASPHSVKAAQKKYPDADFMWADCQTLKPESCGVLVLCEFLEHIHDPVDLCKRWLPLAKFCVMSSPFEGDINKKTGALSLLSSEHVWSFDTLDFRRFLSVGGHELIGEDTFQMGGYRIRIQLSHRKKD